MLNDGQASKEELWAEIWRLREEAKGPGGFTTWKDAAIHERVARNAARGVRTALETPITIMLLQDFVLALDKKLSEAEKKYGYTDGWAKPDWMDECRTKLREHVEKGDPLDVAAYCAFLWWHGERTNG